MSHLTTSLNSSIHSFLDPSRKDPISDQDVERILIEATYSETLRHTANSILDLPSKLISDCAAARARQAIATCQSISDFSKNESDKLGRKFRESGIESRAKLGEIERGSLQYHSVFIEIPPASIDHAISIAKQHGYSSVNKLSPAAWKSYKASRFATALVKTDDTTTRLVLSWGNSRDRKSRSQRFVPSDSDYRNIALPIPLWRFYPLVRLYRGIKSKIGIKANPQSEWPFLGTPASLIEPLLRMAEINEGDLVIDIGCGDARILIEATKQYGCRSIGIEADKTLFNAARKKVSDRMLEDKIDLYHRRAEKSDLATANVIFLFLPVQSIQTLFSSIQESSISGTRLIVHEQERIVTNIPPTQTKLLLRECAITVAHLWQF